MDTSIILVLAGLVGTSIGAVIALACISTSHDRVKLMKNQKD